MNENNHLPENVLDAIHAGRKIEAIKHLREHNGMGLKEAKHAVDNYEREHPELIVRRESSASGFGFVILILVLIAAYSIFA